jgi:hypothetical protein
MNFGTSFLIILSVILGIWGMNELTNASAGIGLIGLACLLAIWARINQAEVNRSKD